MEQTDTYQCLECKDGALGFVRVWLGREIRECNTCHARFTYKIYPLEGSPIMRLLYLCCDVSTLPPMRCKNCGQSFVPEVALQGFCRQTCVVAYAARNRKGNRNVK